MSEKPSKQANAEKKENYDRDNDQLAEINLQPCRREAS